MKKDIVPGVKISGLSFKVYDWWKYIEYSRRSSEAERLVANEGAEISKFSVCSKYSKIKGN